MKDTARWVVGGVALAIMAGCSAAPASLTGPTAGVSDTDARASGGPVTLSMQASKWQTLSNPGNAYPLTTIGGALTFTGPIAPNSMNYLYQASPSTVLTGTVRVSLTVTGSTWYPVEPCGVPGAEARVFLHSYRDNWDVLQPSARWWARAGVPLVAGAVTVAVPLDWTLWSNAEGKQDAVAFADALRNVSSLGMTFGSACFYGHGVSVTGGAASVAISGYTVG